MKYPLFKPGNVVYWREDQDKMKRVIGATVLNTITDSKSGQTTYLTSYFTGERISENGLYNTFEAADL